MIQRAPGGREPGKTGPKAKMGPTDLKWSMIGVLIFDPDDQFRFWASTIFKRLRAGQVHGTASVGEAVRIATTTDVSVLILDIGPGETGAVDIIRRIRDRRASPVPDLPIVILTRSLEKALLAKACAGGVEAVATKPISEQDLIQTVSKALTAQRRILPADIGLEPAAWQPPSLPRPPVIEAEAAPRPVRRPAPAAAVPVPPVPVPPAPRPPAPGQPKPAPVVQRPAPAARPAAPLDLPMESSPGQPVERERRAPPPTDQPMERERRAAPPTDQPMERERRAAPPMDLPMEGHPDAPPSRTRAQPPADPRPDPRPDRRPGQDLRPVPRIQSAPVPRPAPDVRPPPKPRPAPKMRSPAAARLAANLPPVGRVAPPRVVQDRIAAHQVWLVTGGSSGSRMSFAGMDLTSQNLAAANLVQADMRGARLISVDLTGASLTEADLRHADLSGARLANANLGVARLRHAHACAANLDGANLRGADLAGADLSGVDFGEADVSSAIFLETRIDDADLSRVRGLTSRQIVKVFGNEGTRLPPGISSPGVPPPVDPDPEEEDGAADPRFGGDDGADDDVLELDVPVDPADMGRAARVRRPEGRDPGYGDNGGRGYGGRGYGGDAGGRRDYDDAPPSRPRPPPKPSRRG